MNPSRDVGWVRPSRKQMCAASERDAPGDYLGVFGWLAGLRLPVDLMLIAGFRLLAGF